MLAHAEHKPAPLANSPKRKSHSGCGRTCMVVFVPGVGIRVQALRCESWSCSYCKRRLWAKWIGRCKSAFAEGWRPDTFVTLTIDPKKLRRLGIRPICGKRLDGEVCRRRFCCNEWEGIASDYLLQRRWFGQRLRALWQKVDRAAPGWKKTRKYIRVYEAQRAKDYKGKPNGRLHCHILLDCPLPTAGVKPAGWRKGRDWPGRSDAADWWHENAQDCGFGFHSESVTLRELDPYTDDLGKERLPHAVGYLFKYLMKATSETYGHRIRMVSTSQNFPKSAKELEASELAELREREGGERVFARRLGLHRGEVLSTLRECGVDASIDGDSVVLPSGERLPFELMAECPEWEKGKAEVGEISAEGYRLPSGQLVSHEPGLKSFVDRGRFLFRLGGIILSQSGLKGVAELEGSELWNRLLESSACVELIKGRSSFRSRALQVQSNSMMSPSSMVLGQTASLHHGMLASSLVSIQRTAKTTARQLRALIFRASKVCSTNYGKQVTSSSSTERALLLPPLPPDVCLARKGRVLQEIERVAGRGSRRDSVSTRPGDSGADSASDAQEQDVLGRLSRCNRGRDLFSGGTIPSVPRSSGTGRAGKRRAGRTATGSITEWDAIQGANSESWADGGLN